MSSLLRLFVMREIKSLFSTQSSCLIPNFSKISFSSLIDSMFRLLGIYTKLALGLGSSAVVCELYRANSGFCLVLLVRLTPTPSLDLLALSKRS